MKLSKDTLAILKNFSSINPGIILQEGNFIMTRSITKTIYVEAQIADEIDCNMGIYDLSGFLGVLGMAGDDAEITHDESTSTIHIVNGKSKIFYRSADESTIVQPKKKINAKAFENSNVSFDLSAEDLQQIQRISRAMSIDTLAVANKNNKIVINGYNQGVDESMTNVLYSLEVGDWEGNADFNLLINMNNLKLLTADYHVDLIGGAVKFTAEKFFYVIVLEANSTNTF
ncbi:sliding clamp DNA polymerase [Providencia phage PSTRCR_127]|nr:sliding clamp DNA polymerase [Providencia phage PSTRCR_127]